MKLSIALLLALFFQSAFSQCFLADNFKGTSAISDDNYNFGQDGITGQSFKIHLKGAESRISSSSLKCHQSGAFSLLCLDTKDGKSVVETWAVDLQTSKALYTKSVSGYGKYDGVKAFVGRVSGKCN